MVSRPLRISIHALLAESDYILPFVKHLLLKFLSTLSLRRATLKNAITAVPQQISIHALLAESDEQAIKAEQTARISIHALLAESDSQCRTFASGIYGFLSTLSLRRATQ